MLANFYFSLFGHQQITLLQLVRQILYELALLQFLNTGNHLGRKIKTHHTGGRQRFVQAFG